MLTPTGPEYGPHAGILRDGQSRRHDQLVDFGHESEANSFLLQPLVLYLINIVVVKLNWKE